MSLYYLLDENKKPYSVDLGLWTQWFEKNRKHVRLTKIKKYNIVISTVFLGLDHGYPEYWDGNPKDYEPIVFETMMFWNKQACPYYKRYGIWQEAIEGHRETVRTVIDVLRQDPDKNLNLSLEKPLNMLNSS